MKEVIFRPIKDLQLDIYRNRNVFEIHLPFSKPHSTSSRRTFYEDDLLRSLYCIVNFTIRVQTGGNDSFIYIYLYIYFIDCDTSDETDTLSLETMLSSISNKRYSDEQIA